MGVDVFSREFQAETPQFYEKAIEAGKITVGDKVATVDTVIGHNELVCHTVHRHEPPVSAQPLTLIHNDDLLVVLDKPPSIPVHPCGRYRHNSVVFLLGKEHNLKNLHTVHRLDRLTSGLLIFAKTIAKAQQLDEEIRERKVTKVYVCRVKGEFPSESIECNEPILVVSHKLGVCRVDSAGKECSTHFTRLSFDGRSSVVQCVPKTGRMHQIRVHLQWLGFPIMNDPLYGHPAWKVGGASDSANVDHVISEIVKSNYMSAITLSCLAIVCVNLACAQLGEPFDKKAAQRLSGVSSKVYLSSYQTVEKLLNVSTQVTLQDLAVRFGCLEAQPLAEALLENYRVRVEEKYTAAQKLSLDTTKTLYHVAALYCACKLLKIRCEKSKFQASSTSTKQVFQNVLDEMNKCAPKNIDEFKSRKKKQTKSVVREEGQSEDASGVDWRREVVRGGDSKRRRETVESRIQSNPTSQLYLQWRENTLRLARQRLLETEP